MQNMVIKNTRMNKYFNSDIVFRNVFKWFRWLILIIVFSVGEISELKWKKEHGTWRKKFAAWVLN